MFHGIFNVRLSGFVRACIYHTQAGVWLMQKTITGPYSRGPVWSEAAPIPARLGMRLILRSRRLQAAGDSLA